MIALPSQMKSAYLCTLVTTTTAAVCIVRNGNNSGRNESRKFMLKIRVKQVKFRQTEDPIYRTQEIETSTQKHSQRLLT